MIQYTPELDADTVAFWQFKNNLEDDSGNGHTLVQNGTVNLQVEPVSTISNWNAGTYSIPNYFTGPASLDTALAGLSNYTIEGYINFNALSAVGNINVVFGNVVSDSTLLSFRNDFSLRIVVNDGIYDTSAASSFTNNAWYFWALTYDGSTAKAFLSPETNVSSTPIITLSTAFGDIPSNGNMRLGRHIAAGGFELPINAYMKNIRISNVTKTTFPTVDPKPVVN